MIEVSAPPACIVIAGPTASGKTGLAIELALLLDAEIVSADSMLVYRRMDIGTAKPGVEARRGVPHHLIDIIDPSERYDAARFRADALVALGGIASRGRPAIVVGGTGLYLRALLSGLAEAPGADPAFREALGREAARDGTAALHARLARIDPETARRVHPNDLVRIERALEIHHATGRPASELRSAHGFRGVGPRAVTCVLDLPDGVLRSNIALRADAMLRAGLVDEVRRLGEMGFGPDLKPMKALNYRHAWMHLRGEIALNDLPERMVADTWHFARRQRRWFRAEPGAELVPPDLGAILSRLGLPAR